MTIDAWLAELGLSQYAAIFAENAIDFEVLSDLTDADLEKLGVLLGHRKKLLRAIKEREVAPTASPPASQPATAAEAERRQITVLFSDLVGSTDLSRQIDPEQLRDLLAAYQAMATAAIKQAGGTLAKFLGDGVLAYFGYPAASENDAIRAVRAGRAMIAGMAAVNASWRAALGRDIELRVGIHTGLVVAGDVRSGESRDSNAIVGETPNLAARVQALAPPGAVAVSDATWRLVRRAFSGRALGRQEAKGVAEGIEIHIVEDETRADDALEAGGNDGPLVGRDAELALLLERLNRARAGNGQAVLIGGEAGLGKSRLTRAFRETGGLESGDVMVLRCAPQLRNSALYPMIALLERRLGIDTADTPAPRQAKLDAALAMLAIARPEIARPLAELLGATAGQDEMSEEQRRRRLLAAMRQYLIAEATARPRALIVEDAHWLDASTQELVGLLLGALADVPLLLIITFRPEFVPPWPVASHVTALALARLTADQVAAIVRQRAGRDLSEAVLRQLLDKTEGIPLFAEELTQSVIASGAVVERDGRYELSPESGALAIPSTLRDSLTARLDRLSGARQVAQIAAVIGREFPYDLLAAVAERDAETLERDLDALVRNDILRQRGVPPQATYSFKHALLQEAAYDVLLRATRQHYHAQIARSYERLFPAAVESFPEIVAQHCASAGMDERAFDYYVRAGDQTRRRAGISEGAAHFRAALERLSHLPESQDRDRREIDVLLKLGSNIGALESQEAPAYRNTYDRAYALAAHIGDDQRRFAAAWGLWFADVAAMDGEAAERRSRRNDEMFAVARKLGDPDLELEAYHSRWATRFMVGDLRGTRADTAEGVARYDPVRHAHHRFTYGGHDTGVCAHAFAGVCAVVAGEPERSVALTDKGFEIARSIGDPSILSHALMFSAMAAQFRGDLAACRTLGEEALSLHKAHGIKAFSGLPIAIAGWAHHMAGDRKRGRDMMEIGLSIFQMMWTPYLHALLADVEAETDPPAALARLKTDHAAGLSIASFDAETIRRIGALTLLVDPGARDEAAAHFRDAIAIAQRQGALAFELRAAFALARLLAEKSRGDEAQALLAPVLAQFAPGLVMPDLPEARDFLATLPHR